MKELPVLQNKPDNREKSDKANRLGAQQSSPYLPTTRSRRPFHGTRLNTSFSCRFDPETSQKMIIYQHIVV